MPEPFDRRPRDDDEEDVPTRLQRPPRVQIHPKLDPRRIPTLRRLAVVRSLAAPLGDRDLVPPSRHSGVTLAWVVAFLAAAYLAVLVAVVLAVR